MSIDETDEALKAILDGVTLPSEPSGIVIGESWEPRNLEAALSGETAEQPTMLFRCGVPLIYPGRIHEIKGKPEAGKGWLAMLYVREQLLLGNAVFYIDWEDHEIGIVSRLKALGVPDEIIASELFGYIRPEEPFGGEASSRLDELLVKYRPVGVVLDGVTEAMVTNNLNPLDNTDAARFISMLPRRITDALAAAILLDHVTKAIDGSRYAIGAQHKLAAVDGASYRVENVEPFGRGRKGRSRIFVDKDRPGFVRQHAMEGKRIADLTLYSDREGLHVTAELTPPDGMTADGHFWPTATMEKISKFLESVKPQMPNLRTIREELGGKSETISAAIDALVEGGYVSRSGGTGRSGVTHGLIKPYEAPLDLVDNSESDDDSEIDD